jgi:hypothetical protein
MRITTVTTTVAVAVIGTTIATITTTEPQPTDPFRPEIR